MKKIINILILVFTCTLVVLVAGCSSDGELEKITPNDFAFLDIEESTRAAGEKLNNFYIDFTTDAVKYVDSSNDIESKNVIVSPVSVSILLAMLANGVEEDMAQQIIDYLGCQDKESLNRFISVILNELPKVDNQARINFNNAIWVDNQLKINSDYYEILQTIFSSDINYADISNNTENVLKAINSWSYKNTDGLIPTILDYLNNDTFAVLLNSIYFKAPWKINIFDSKNTITSKFNGLKKVSDVKMMNSDFDMRSYSCTENFEALDLVFGNSAFNMLIVLPRESLSTEEANALFTAEEFSRLYAQGTYLPAKVRLPKFKLQCKLDLNKILQQTPIAQITETNKLEMFDSKKEGVLEFNQATSLEIDEKGAVVATTTSATATTGAPIFPTIVDFNVNRPFYFFIIETSTRTRTCILSGRIADL